MLQPVEFLSHKIMAKLKFVICAKVKKETKNRLKLH